MCASEARACVCVCVCIKSSKLWSDSTTAAWNEIEVQRRHPDLPSQSVILPALPCPQCRRACVRVCLWRCAWFSVSTALGVDSLACAYQTVSLSNRACNSLARLSVNRICMPEGSRAFWKSNSKILDWLTHTGDGAREDYQFRRSNFFFYHTVAPHSDAAWAASTGTEKWNAHSRAATGGAAVILFSAGRYFSSS